MDSADACGLGRQHLQIVEGVAEQLPLPDCSQDAVIATLVSLAAGRRTRRSSAWCTCRCTCTHQARVPQAHLSTATYGSRAAAVSLLALLAFQATHQGKAVRDAHLSMSPLAAHECGTHWHAAQACCAPHLPLCCPSQHLADQHPSCSPDGCVAHATPSAQLATPQS